MNTTQVQAKAQDSDTRAAWDAIAADFDRTNTPTQMAIATEGLRRAGLRAGMRFLDVAAGSGALSIPAARLGADVLATDRSPAMLELLRNRARSEGLSVEARVMDGHALELDDDYVDLAGSQFGVMLFPDMPKGIREMRRVVRPGGRVLINAYGDPRRIEFLRFFVGAIQSVRPGFQGLPTDPPPLEFQLANPERLHRELASAGLQNVKVKTVIESTDHESPESLWDWIVSSNPIAERILSRVLGITDNERRVVLQTLGSMFQERADGDGVATLRNPVNIGIGTK